MQGDVWSMMYEKYFLMEALSDDYAWGIHEVHCGVVKALPLIRIGKGKSLDFARRLVKLLEQINGEDK